MRKVGISINAAQRMSVYQSQIDIGLNRKLPGRPVGLIEVGQVEPKGRFNPLVLTFTVSHYRKDFKRVLMQNNRKDRLSNYAQSLFDSSFKKWE